jgi:ABC-type transport system substrate-binding protein
MSVWGEAAQRGAVAYPYDLRRSEQLMADAGFSRGADGLYGSPGGGRLTFEVKTNAASDNESEVSILASSWRQGGFDSHEAVLPAAQAQNPELRATFSGVFTNSQNCCESALLGLTTAAIPTADNRWTGGNRSGWSNAEFDRLVAVFSQTLDRAQRDAQMTQMTQILTNDVQSISLFIRAQPWVYVAELHGLSIAPPEGNMSWNMHQWELR